MLCTCAYLRYLLMETVLHVAAYKCAPCQYQLFAVVVFNLFALMAFYLKDVPPKGIFVELRAHLTATKKEPGRALCTTGVVLVALMILSRLVDWVVAESNVSANYAECVELCINIHRSEQKCQSECAAYAAKEATLNGYPKLLFVVLFQVMALMDPLHTRERVHILRDKLRKK